MLSREQMEQVIKEGGSVLHDGQIISNIKELPYSMDDLEKDKAELAKKEAKIKKEPVSQKSTK